MSIIKSSEVSLSELVKDANLIIKVKYLEAFEESLPVIDRSKNQADNPLPPFIKKGCVFHVVETLKNTARIDLPENVRVPNENWRRSMSQHKEKHAGGTSKSFSVPTYITEVSSLRKAEILFLQHFQGMFDLAARDSFENLAAEDKIKMLLEQS
ncbi:MAG: hypothetical protein WKF87_00295 [Chryseolinea sp.]